MPTNSDPVAALGEHLRRHEPALRAIPGVIGCGIGLTADGSQRPVIQVFVATAVAAESVADAAAVVLGTRAFDVVVMSPPSADERRPKAPDRTREDP
jgi:hypothetical protein